VQSRLVGQDDEHVRLDEVGHECRERVVIAEADLVDRDGVVFVDDRDDAQREKRAQRRSCVEIALAVREIFVRQQNLGGHQIVLPEAGFVHLDETHLPDGGGGL